MRSDLKEEYRTILQAYRAGLGEAASLSAYEFTRRCLREGLAPEDVMAFHLDLVERELGPDAAARGQDLLLEVIMAFSVAYQQAMRELERGNLELEKLSGFKSRMLSMVAHDMMNHVVASKMVAVSLRADTATEPRLHPRLATLLQIVDDQEHLIQNLLDLGRIESGHSHLNLEHIDLNQLVARTVLKAQSGSTPHTFTVDGDAVSVHADRSKLQQVLDNLVSNAVKYSPAGGAIDISIGTTAREICISIRDSGLGISPADRPHLFEPFFRGKTGRGDIRGTGLGLAIVQSLVKLHHGQLEVESEPGHGSVFRVHLPATQPAIERRTP